MQFNRSQEIAVTHDRGPMMVLAGPGSGKTMVITHRVRWLIEEAGVHPAGILVVTFTKAAADEMRQRFVSLMGQELPVIFGTFHAVFFNILRYAYHYTAANIIREDQKYQLMKELIERYLPDTDNVNDMAGELLAETGLVKGGLMDLSHYYATSCPADSFRRIYKAYNETLRARNLLDFEDMMVDTWALFKERKDILKGWQQRFQYVLIDEFQDINLLQYQLIRLLAAPQDNLFIVGDDDQSIYGFRGARPELMLGFEKDYPKAVRVRLSVNYRSQGAIVKAAGSVIGNNRQRFDKEIQAARPEKDPVDIRMFAGPADEQAAVIREIRRYHDEAGVPFSEMAILFRTNTQARGLLEKLMAYNIPFRMQDAMPNIYQHWISRDVMAYLRISLGSEARSDYLRIVNRPNRYISRQSMPDRRVNMTRLAAFYRDKDWMLDRIGKMAQDLAMMRTMPPYAAINYIRKGIGYDQFLDQYAREHRIDLSELIQVLDELQESAKPFRSFKDWEEHIRIYTERLKEQAARRRTDKEDCVSLETMHHAKGLEYQVVMIVDANEHIIPHQKALLDADVEEERRMFYVAMTRARDHLHIFFLKERYGRPMVMSRFVGEILMDRRVLKPGVRVVHKAYGPGLIREMGDHTITIRFDREAKDRRLDIRYCIENQLLQVQSP